VRSSITTLFILAATLAPVSAAGQIVNIQPLLGPEDSPGLSMELKGGMSLYTGNIDLFTGAASLLMRYQAGRHRFISTSSGALGIKNDAQYINKVFSHLRHQFYCVDRFAWETWLQGAENHFTRLALRLLVGIGPRFDIVRGEDFRLAAGLHYMFELEQLSAGGAAEGEPLQELNHRSSSYLTFTWDMTDGLSLQETAYVQPKLDDPLADFRLSNEVQLTAKVSDHFSLGTSFQLAWDRAAPAHVEALDSVTLATLTAGF